jgi:hypothetical protein
MAEDDQSLTCDECGRRPRPDENAVDEWRTYYEGVGDGMTRSRSAPRGSSASSGRLRRRQ